MTFLVKCKYVFALVALKIAAFDDVKLKFVKENGEEVDTKIIITIQKMLPLRQSSKDDYSAYRPPVHLAI